MHSTLKHAIRIPLELFWFKHANMVLQWLVELLNITHVDNGLETQDIVESNMRNMDKLFEKGPVNAHREDCILAEIIFNEFSSMIHKDTCTIMAFNPELLNLLQEFVKTRTTNFNSNLTKNTVYSDLYIIVIGLAMMKVLIEKAILNGMNNGWKENEAYAIFTSTVQWVKELQTADKEQCFHHYKLHLFLVIFSCFKMNFRNSMSISEMFKWVSENTSLFQTLALLFQNY